MHSLRKSAGVLLQSVSRRKSAVAFSTSSVSHRSLPQCLDIYSRNTKAVLHPSTSSTTATLPELRNFSSNASTNKDLKERFDKLVKNNKVVVFMKGVPDEPRCGFSNAVVQILRMHGVVGYDSHDVLSDESIRQGIKDYTNWPTIPQVFINGDFVGGCDILIEMHKNGELVEQLSKVGIKSALLEQDGEKTK